MAARSKSYPIALGGVLAALAVIIMAMGTIIPIATYTCPALCILMGNYVLKSCGRRMAWAWYGAVAFLSLLLAPDKEAAAVFAALGCYPILKKGFDKRKLSWLWKGLFFNAVIIALYWAMIQILGLDQVARDFQELGATLTLVTLALGNVIFVLLDKLLERRWGS